MEKRGGWSVDNNTSISILIKVDKIKVKIKSTFSFYGCIHESVRNFMLFLYQHKTLFKFYGRHRFPEAMWLKYKTKQILISTCLITISATIIAEAKSLVFVFNQLIEWMTSQYLPPNLIYWILSRYCRVPGFSPCIFVLIPSVTENI